MSQENSFSFFFPSYSFFPGFNIYTEQRIEELLIYIFCIACQYYKTNCISFYSSRAASKLTRGWRISRLISDLTPVRNRTPANIQAAPKPSATLAIEQSIKTERTPARYYFFFFFLTVKRKKKDSKTDINVR